MNTPVTLEMIYAEVNRRGIQRQVSGYWSPGLRGLGR